MTNTQKGKFAIMEQGEYSDYTMFFIQIPENFEISNDELEFLLSVGEWSYPSISGYIIGEIQGFEVESLKDRVERGINQMFCCYDKGQYKTVVDKKHTKEELLNIAIANDNSGEDYWKREIEGRYPDYTRAFDLYQKYLLS